MGQETEKVLEKHEKEQAEKEKGDNDADIPAVKEMNEELLHPDAGRSVSDLTKIFKVLGHPARLAVLYTIYKNGSCRYGELSNSLNAEDNELNHHLRTILETPLVWKKPDEEDQRKMIYQLTPMGIRVTEQVLEMMKAERDAIEDEYLDTN